METFSEQPKKPYTVQVAFSAAGAGFSIVMLSIGKEPSIYLPVLTAVLFYWLPSPKLNAKEENKVMHTQTMSSSV